MPKARVLRSDAVICQNTSWPRDVVPNQWSSDGGMSGATA
jgi:hypothetical protein